MTESVTIPGKETMKDHVKPNGPIPSDTHPRVEHRSRKTKGPEENPTMTQATLPTMNATGSTIPTGPRPARPSRRDREGTIGRKTSNYATGSPDRCAGTTSPTGTRKETRSAGAAYGSRPSTDSTGTAPATTSKPWTAGRTSRRTAVRRPGKPRKGKRHERHERRDAGRMPHRMPILPCQRGIRP
ncbi:hypothetical protein BIFDEN_02303 [Bifidobacterium dentium ATCC 27678]|nr:hypothetical protein BIFDEN_02303 [Bifidobacterium dentium ATCC 27678]